MKPVVSIIMGSTSDLPVMEKAAKLLDECEIPFEMLALSVCPSNRAWRVSTPCWPSYRCPRESP